MKSKKVLIITYYWPPSGGPGVQRWLKFATYLPEFGINPVIFSPENPSYPLIDTSLEQEIPTTIEHVQIPIWEPYQLAEFLHPKTKTYKSGNFEKKEKQSLLTKLSVYIRGNFFIPDARKFWVNPSVKYLSNYLSENSIDTIITTGPPHSLHLIGLKLKQNNPKLKWLADFRDPWTQISYHSELKLSHSSKKKHLQFESKVLQTADLVLATSFTDSENYLKLGAKKVEVLTNGFEKHQFENFKKKKNTKFRIVYSGGLEIARNPEVIWKALDTLIKKECNFSEEFLVEFYGDVSEDVKKSLQKYGLNKYCNFNGYVSHPLSIEGISQADLLVLTNFPDEKSKGIIPGKLFEYMATKNPILAVGPSGGDIQLILEDYNLDKYCTHLDLKCVAEFIVECYKNWKKDERINPSSNYKKYSRKALTEKLSKFILD